MATDVREYSLAELAAASGVAARTIRYYIARGVLMPPLRSGRGAGYGESHLQRLGAIQKLQAEGESLSAIRRRWAEEDAPGKPAASAASPAFAPEAWWQYALSDDVTVWVRAGAPPWRLREIQRWMSGMGGSTAEAGPARRKAGRRPHAKK